PEFNEESSPDDSYVRFAAGDTTFTLVANHVRDFGAALEPGTAVTLYVADTRQPGPLCYPIVVEGWMKAGDQLVFQYERSPHATFALPEGFSAAQGDEYCMRRDYCLATTGHYLDVTSDAGSLHLLPRESGALGDFTIYAGGSRQFVEK